MKFGALALLFLILAGIAVALQPTCKYDADCLGDVCKRGACIPRELYDAGCDDDERCAAWGDGNRCVENVCIWACAKDEDCQELNVGNACMDGVCGYAALPDDGICSAYVDCPTGKICINGECVWPSGNATTECSTDDECMEQNRGTECIGGQCAWVDAPIDPVDAFFSGVWNFVSGIWDLLFGWMRG